MNKKMFITGSTLLVMGSLLLISATKDDKKKGFDVKALEKSICTVPAGSYPFEDSAYLPNYPTKMHIARVAQFYMCNHVVTNAEYRNFISDLKITDVELYKKMLPDTMVWREQHIAFMEDMIKYYFNHPAYQDYPVVGVSHEQAQEYCKWLTKRYMKEPQHKYQNVVFRLPTVYEWDWAASGGLANAEFPWAGLSVINSEKKYRGQRMANYRFVSEQSIKRVGDTGKLELTQSDPFYSYGNAPESNDAADITSPVISYWPNGYGLYNMAGNVQEYVAEVGVTKGGSWCDPAYYLQIWAEQHYKNAQSVSDKIGFRVAMEVENK